MFIEVSRAEYLDNYRIKLWFNDGVVKIVDLKDSLRGMMFEPLKDIEYFKQFKINLNTVEWPNEADFAPEYLYEIGEIFPIMKPYSYEDNEGVTCCAEK